MQMKEKKSCKHPGNRCYPTTIQKVGYSQAKRQENVPQATRKLMLEDQNQTESDERMYSNSTSSWKLAASPELKNMEYTNHQYMSKIFQCLRKMLGMSATNATFSMDSYKTKKMTWRLFLTSSMKAAIHYGPNYVSNSEIYKNTKIEDIESVFNITQKLVKEHSEEILMVRCPEYSSPSWTRSILANDQAVKWAKAKVCSTFSHKQLYPHHSLHTWTRTSRTRCCPGLDARCRCCPA